MTRKHYRQIAESFNSAISQASTNYEILAIEELAKSLANTFKDTNELFKRDVFLAACGVKSV
jgi:hypothetical protein